MSIVKRNVAGSASPSPQGGKGWVTLLKVIIAALTALLGAIGASAVI